MMILSSQYSNTPLLQPPLTRDTREHEGTAWPKVHDTL
ncbi:MAG: hypothetical protein QOE70_3669 [Chthoniobacter sp.]|jgi:hypothetical protein|nr:hypothetical protein [Chthoniobacter sp.]